ncbi:MAG TPA: hypothetical protein PKK60_00180 [archaeon]|nr:hypothetical protein [archaeon]
MNKVEIKIFESSALSSFSSGTPVGKHNIQIRAFLNGEPSGTCVMEVSKLHPESPASVGMHFVDLPTSETKALLTAKRLLHSVVSVCNRRGITKATFVPHKKEKFTRALVKYSALFSPHPTLKDQYRFDPTKRPIINREKFFEDFRKKTEIIHKPLHPKFLNARVAKNIHTPRRH